MKAHFVIRDKSLRFAVFRMHTSVFYAGYSPVPFPRRALARIDLNHLGNCCNPAPCKLVHLSSMLPTTEQHSHPLSVQDVLLWHGNLFSYFLRRQDVMWRRPPNCNCKKQIEIDCQMLFMVICISSTTTIAKQSNGYGRIEVWYGIICSFVHYLSPFVSHKCNSPNVPLPSFSTIINECLGNSCNCCISSSAQSASISLQEVSRFPVFDECKLPVDGVNAVLQIAVVA